MTSAENTIVTADETGGAAPAWRRLSRPFEAALPYVVGAHGIHSLLTGSWVLVRKLATWVADGDFLQVFAPARAAKRDAKPATKRAPAKDEKAPGRRRKAKAKKSATPAANGPSKTPTAPAEEKDLPPWAVRLGSLALGAFLIAYEGREAPVWTASAAALCWCAAAWMYSPAPEPTAAADADAEPTDAEDAEPAAGDDDVPGEQRPLTAEETAARYRLCVEHAVAARYAEGVRGMMQGVHIQDLLTGLRAEGRVSDPRLDTTALARYLRLIGIPIRDPLPLKVNRKTVNRVGVHHDDLAAYLGRTPRLPPHLVPDLTPCEGPPGPAPAAPEQAAAAAPGKALQNA